MLEIRHKDDGKKGEFYIGEEGHHLAEMAYTWAGENMLIIDHTLVEDELRGQSVGRKLLDQVGDGSLKECENYSTLPFFKISI